MVADLRQKEVTPSLKSWGLYYEKYVDIGIPPKNKDGQTIYIPRIKGRFDGHANANGKIVYIETKNFDKNFPFSCIDEDKRRWSALQEKFNTPCYIFLCLGEDNPNYAFGTYKPRMAWLFPMSEFYRIENLMMERFGRKSLPYYYGDAKELSIRKEMVDAISLLNIYELNWKDGLWRLPEGHPIQKILELP